MLLATEQTDSGEAVEYHDIRKQRKMAGLRGGSLQGEDQCSEGHCPGKMWVEKFETRYPKVVLVFNESQPDRIHSPLVRGQGIGSDARLNEREARAG